MDSRRAIKREEPAGSSLPENLHPLLFNEPPTPASTTTSAARSTLHVFPLRHVYDEHPPVSVPHRDVPSHSPDEPSPSGSEQHPYPEHPYSEPTRGRRGVSYPRQLSSPRHFPELDPLTQRSAYSYPQNLYQTTSYPPPPHSRRESHSLPRLGPSSPMHHYNYGEHDLYLSQPSSSSIPGASDDDGQDSGRHRGASKRKTGSSEEEGEDYGDEEDRLSRRVPKMKKVQVACNFCRGRKLRCDGSRPSCHNCATRGMRCEYVDVLKRRGPGKAPKGSRPKKRPSSTPQDERIERKHSASPTAIPQEYSRPVFDIYRPPRSPPTMPGPVYSHPQAGRYGLAPTISDFPFSSFSSPSSSRPVPPLLPPLQTYLPTVVDDNRQYAPLPRRSRGTRRQSTPPLDGDDDKERSEF